MNFDDLSQSGDSSNVQADPFSSVPSYLVAVDNHNIGSGNGSIFNPDSWTNGASDLFQFTVSAATRAAVDTYNLVPTVANWFGADLEKANTEDWLRGMDDNLGNYYNLNKRGVDIVGDIGASFIPGLAGVKVLNWAQKGLQLAAAGEAGLGISEAFGLLPDKMQTVLGALGKLPGMATSFGEAAASDIASASASFSWINANTLKSLAAGYGQSALENTAFLIAGQTAMHDSPLFSDQDASDIAYNALLGGGVVGGGIMGALSAAKTFGVIRKAVKAVDVELHPFQNITRFGEGAAPADRILSGIDDLGAKPPLDSADPLYTQKFRALESRDRTITNNIYAATHEMLDKKDVALGNATADAILMMDSESAWNNMPGLKVIARAQQTTKLEKAENELLKAAKNAPKTSDIQQLAEPTLSKTFLKLHGEDAGVVTDVAPAKEILSIADITSNVTKFVSSQGFKLGDGKTPMLLDTAQEAEARYIKMSSLDRDSFFKEIKTPAGKVTTPKELDQFDIPALEQAYRLRIPQVTIKDIGSVELTGNYLQNAKMEAAKNLQELYPEMTTAEIAKRVNVRTSLLNGIVDTQNPVDDYFAMQTASKRLTERMINAGLHNANKPELNAWEHPQYVKLVRDITELPKDSDGNFLLGAQYTKQMQLIQKQKNANIFADYAGDHTQLFDDGIPDKALLQTNRLGAGSTVFNSANGGYGTVASTMEARGTATNIVQKAKRDIIAERMTAPNYAVLNNPDAGLELTGIRQQLLSTSEKYVLSQDGDQLIPAKLADAIEAKGGNISEDMMEELQDVAIDIEHPETQQWLRAWVNHNSEYVDNVRKNLGASGIKSSLRPDTVYFPPPDPKSFNHFAFVVDPQVTSTGHVKMIWAASAADLEKLAEKVPTEFKVLFKADTDEFNKARQAYEYSAGINENYFDAAFARKGVAAPFFPKTDATGLVNELMDFANRNSDRQVRDFIYTKYSNEFQTLEDYGNQYTKLATSKAVGSAKYAADQVDNPYLNYIKTALNLSTYNEIPLLSQANRLAETAVTKVSSAVGQVFGAGAVKTPEDLEAINSMMKEKGISAINYDSAMNALANHQAPKPALLNFVRKANAIFSTFMLRADPMNALNNGLGANVLLGAETHSLINGIKSSNSEAAGALAALGNITLPGVGDQILSPTKLIASAYSDFGKLMAKDPEMLKQVQYFRTHGLMPRLIDQQAELLGGLAVEATDTAATLGNKLSNAVKSMNQNVDFWTGNRLAEDMNRFVAASVAKKLTDLGLQAGVLNNEKEAISYINTFVNRTQGNYLASQRPLLFQGPIGQAIGLFQTYQFNMLQQMFRYVADGQAKSAAVLLSMQGSIYGMNGLPAFNAINNHIVGTAAGNRTNQDLYSGTYDVAGKNVGDWLLYGAGSNALGLLHPDLKTNLYSRGDINPRQVSVVPTSLSEIPIVSGMANVLGSIKNTAQSIAAGGDIWGSFLRGIEHAQISRPLAGLAQIAEATANPANKVVVTDSAGNLVAANDLFTLASLSRLTGARPLDEALARDATFRMSIYKESHAAMINTLGDAIKTKVQAGDIPTTDELNNFQAEYVKRGGNLGSFNQFFSRQAIAANKSRVNVMIDSAKGPTSQYMQKIMGGYELQDFKNSAAPVQTDQSQ